MGKNRTPGKFTSSKMDNSKLSIGAAKEVLYQVVGSGVDSATNVYFDFGRSAEGVTIRATAACSITEINGKTLKSPMSINPGANKIEAQIWRFNLVTTASSVVEVTIK